MGKAIGGSLPLAVGIALSPIPIIAVVLMLTSRKARVNGPAFIVGWLLGLGIVGVIVLSLAGSAGASKSSSPAAWVSWVKIVLGVLLLLVAARQFRSRPHGDQEAQMPKLDGHDRQDHPARGARPGRRAHSNAVIMSVLCLIIAAKLIGDAISSLAG